MQQINIVISGFTPYEGIDVNPAVLVPAAVAKQWADPAQSQAISEELLQDIAVTVTNVTLPVSFAKAWPTLLEAIEQAKPDIVIATGLKRTSRGILLERCATNLMDAAKPDADNVIPPRRPIGRSGRVLDAPAVAVDTARFRQTRDSRRVEFRRRYVRMQFAVLPSAQLVGGPGTSHSVGVRQPADRQRSAARTWTVDRTADRCGR